MRIGIGGLGWRPEDFWRATITEFFEAINGHNESQGGDAEPTAPTKNEMAGLLEKYG
jgi:hypothetical protein